MSEEIYICHNCEWEGKEEKAKTLELNEGVEMLCCPKCKRTKFKIIEVETN